MDSRNSPEFHIIGAGLPRSGTRSMREAFHLLYDGEKSYHMIENIKSSENREMWARIARREKSFEELREWLLEKNYTSGFDFPFSFYYRELAKVFPSARVVLTVRDPKEWYKSVKGTLFELHQVRQKFPYNLIKFTATKGYQKIFWTDIQGRTGSDKGMYGSVRSGEEKAIAFYEEWVAEVKRVIPDERLLIFNPNEGWDPLCTFLDKPLPDKPFPHVNESIEFKKTLTKLKVGIWLILFIVLFLFSIVLRWIWTLISGP